MTSSKKPKITKNPLSFYDWQNVASDGLLSDAMDPDSMKRAAARVFGNQVKRELAESKQELKAVLVKIGSLEAAIAKEARINRSSRADELRKIIHQLKRTNRDRASNALFIASKVDAFLKREKRQLYTVCPKNWKDHAPTNRLVDLLNPKTYPKLHKLVKSYISKA